MCNHVQFWHVELTYFSNNSLPVYGRQEKNGGAKEETGMQRSLTERLDRSRLQWAGHVERMADDRLQKRAA